MKSKILFISFIFFIMGCFPSKRIGVATIGMIMEDIDKASNKSENLEIIREGAPAFLMLIDGLIEAYPNNERLLIAGAKAYSSYTFSFIEEKDKDLAKRMYKKGMNYGLRALFKNKKFKEAFDKPIDKFNEALSSFKKRDVPALFWTANCWASFINLSQDSVEALADLPKVVSMMRRVLSLNERFYYGGPHLFFAIYYARSKALGGDLDKAAFHFKRAIEISEGKFLMDYVLYAKYYARQVFDRELFISTLKKVIETRAEACPELTIANTLAKKRAKILLEHVDDYF